MKLLLVKLPLIVCLAALAWVGCGRGPWVFVCLHTNLVDHSEATCETDPCDHDHPQGSTHHHPAQLPEPDHDHDCPFCLDLVPPETAVVTARVAAPDDLSRALDSWFPIPPMLVLAHTRPPELNWPPWGWIGRQPDAHMVRVSCGLTTTRLLL